MLDLHRGQNVDICWGENSMVPSVRDYLDMVDNKTGRLFAAAARMGSICSGHAALGQAAAQALLDLGRFFQIRDDLCNACDPAYWRSKGFFEDCNEGKISYIVLLFLERTHSTPGSAHEAEQHWLRERLCDDAPVALEERLRAYDILHAASTLEAVRETCLALLAQLTTQQLFASPRGEKILAQLYIPDVLDPLKVRAVLESTSHVPAA
jgi:geranylgeranyl pyrophosphate synthase